MSQIQLLRSDPDQACVLLDEISSRARQLSRQAEQLNAAMKGKLEGGVNPFPLEDELWKAHTELERVWDKLHRHTRTRSTEDYYGLK